MTTRLFACTVAVLALMPIHHAVPQEASQPQGVTLSIYDVGFAIVNELRRVTMGPGDSEIVLRRLPSRLDPSSASLTPAAGGSDVALGDQRFEYDLGDSYGLLRRYLGREVTVRTQNGDSVGTLIAAPQASAVDLPVTLSMKGGDVQSVFSLDDIQTVIFPGAGTAAFTSPTLIWSAKSPREGVQQMRLSYLVHGLSWNAYHEVMLQPGGARAHLFSRVGIKNETGGRFQSARARLITSDKGVRDPILPDGEGRDDISSMTRYSYGAKDPILDRLAASYATVATHELPEPVSLVDGESSIFALTQAQDFPVATFYVYDGVKFDRFQRNRRNDWNYGTEYHESIETHVEIENSAAVGLGKSLPSGRVRLYQQREDGSIDLLGEDQMHPVMPGEKMHVRIGPARGLRGERERTGFSEIRPLHEYEESFEIRLENATQEDVQIRVVEHLYRWTDYEIVKSDTEYAAVSPQTIEFKADVSANGKRAIHYTVRYRW